MLRSTGWAGAIKRTTYIPRAGPTPLSIPIREAYPDAPNKEEVAARAGYEVSGGGFNALGRLRTLDLVLTRPWELRASDNFVQARGGLRDFGQDHGEGQKNFQPRRYSYDAACKPVAGDIGSRTRMPSRVLSESSTVSGEAPSCRAGQVRIICLACSRRSTVVARSPAISAVLAFFSKEL